jgi:hypothetical protein
MNKLLATAALATLTLAGASGAAQAGGYGYSYTPSYYVEAPVYHVYRPRYVKRYYAPSYSYHGGY